MKPFQLYDIIRQMMKEVRGLELFARPHNACRDFVAIGNESIYFKDETNVLPNAIEIERRNLVSK